MSRPARGSAWRLVILATAFVGAAIAWWLVAGGQTREGAGAAQPVVDATHDPQPTPRFQLEPNERLGEARPLEPSNAPRSPMPAPADLRSTVIVGRVLRPDGRPVPAAHILVANSDHVLSVLAIPLLPSDPVEPPAGHPILAGRRYGAGIRGSAGPDGSIRIPLDAELIGQLGGGTLVVAAIAEGRDVALHTCGPLTPGETRLGDIVLPICAGLRLRVVMPAGVRPTEAMVRAIVHAAPEARPSMSESWLGSRWVPEGGVVAIGGRPPGATDVRVDAPGARLARLPDVQLVEGEWTELGDVLLVAGDSIAGVVVTADGSPLPDAQLQVLADAEPEPERLASLETLGRRAQWARIAPDGRFEATGLDPGSHSLVLKVPGYATAILEGVQTGRRDVQLVLQRPAVILLTVLDASTGAAIEGAEITVTAPPEARVGLFMVPAPDALIETGAENGLTAGLYRVVGAAPGGTHLTVRAKGFATGTLDVPPLAPESQWTARLSLARGLVVRGRVVDLDDRPIVEAKVQLASREESLADLETTVATVDAEGHFEFADLPAGDWLCWAGADGYFSSPSVEFALQDDIEDALVRLTPEARIEGRVLAADGAPAEGCTVGRVMLEPALVADRAPYTPQLLVESSVRERGRSAAAVQDGRYAVENLAPGLHLVGAARLAEDDFEAWVEAWAANAKDPSAALPDGVQRVVL
ncbi:MAG TPA: carboxypeptidase-like regulatory domain-containing protein, partial [Planctomycetota bacterium]|nr:carboxypeptidase-like regulatory domain-containing protein [Planctomycetota bacterium]